MPSNTPATPRRATLTAEDYQDLIDAADAKAAMRAVAAGTLQTLSGDDVEGPARGIGVNLSAARPAVGIER